jgi:hypothetical protein
VAINLALGNLSLWLFETVARDQEGLDSGWSLGFSLAALIALWLAYRWSAPNQSWLRSMLLAAGVSAFVVIAGLAFSLAPAGPLKAVAVALIAGPMFLVCSLPMALVNALLFHWTTKA